MKLFLAFFTKALLTDGGTEGRRDGPTDGPTDTCSYRDARTHLKVVTVFAYLKGPHYRKKG